MSIAVPSGQARVFIAIPLEPALLAELQNLQQRLKNDLAKKSVRWTRPEQLHLTVKFLGNVARGRLKDLEVKFECACKDVTPLRLCVENVGCFPGPKNPRVVCVGIGGEVSQLKQLQEQIDQATRGLGDHTEERAFHPHLTIGRVKANSSEALRVGEAIQAAKVGEVGGWTVKQVDLMESKLAPEGATYTKLASAHLIEKRSVVCE